MSSVHHKTAYEEVATEKGDNNKLKSSNAMLQPKFIYMAFAIVFVVILIQGIVLYCVLKQSTSTRQQSHLLDKMINSVCKKSTEKIPSFSNNSVNLFGTTVDTSPLISKIESTLTNYDKSTFGRAIRFKPTDECLSNGVLPSHSVGHPFYKVYPASCDRSSFQQWRKAERHIQVGIASNYPKHGSSFTPCLACHIGYRSCELVVHPCSDISSTAHNFIIRIYPSQIDLANSRVYFSIHDELYSTQCLGLQYNAEYKANVFQLQECTGSDHQTFYMEDANLTAEIDDIRAQLSSVMWSVLLGSDARQNC